MSSQYEPSAGAEPVLPWSIAFLSQRDLALAIPINYVTQPAVSLSEACFSRGAYEDAAARLCLSNLLALGFKRIVVDLYWDVGRGLWSLCPVEIPESASSDDDATVGIVSSTSDAAFSSVAMSTASLQPRQATALSTSALTSTNPRSSPTGTVLESSVSVSPTGQAAGSGVVQTSSYNCSSSLNVSTVSSLVADYLDATGDTINASLIYLIFNIHAAASNSTAKAPGVAPDASQLPTANTTLSNILSADLSSYLYTPTQLREDRANLNNSWFGYDTAQDPGLKPALPYLQIINDDNVASTPDGWPSEGVLEFGPDHLRLLASFGRVDTQMAGYDTQADSSILFPEGTFESIQNLAFSEAGTITNGCFFDRNITYLTGSTNSSWAMSSNLPIQDMISTQSQNSTSPYISNMTSCGISPLLNQTLLDTADTSYEPYRTISYSSIWSWADNEPRNVTNKADNASYLRCATMQASTHGRWVLTDCTEKHHAACRVGGSNPYEWRISDPSDSYTDADSICPSGSSFDAPRTALENRYLFDALQSRANEHPEDFNGAASVWVNFNSLDVTDCWVVGVSQNCPYSRSADQDENRLVVVPTVAAVIVFVCTVLTLFVKCAGNRQSSRKSRRRRMQEGWEYEGVPS